MYQKLKNDNKTTNYDLNFVHLLSFQAKWTWQPNRTTDTLKKKERLTVMFPVTYSQRKHNKNLQDPHKPTDKSLNYGKTRPLSFKKSTNKITDHD